jgi:hypothetical protein
MLNLPNSASAFRWCDSADGTGLAHEIVLHHTRVHRYLVRPLGTRMPTHHRLTDPELCHGGTDYDRNVAIRDGFQSAWSFNIRH